MSGWISEEQSGPLASLIESAGRRIPPDDVDLLRDLVVEDDVRSFSQWADSSAMHDLGETFPIDEGSRRPISREARLIEAGVRRCREGRCDHLHESHAGDDESRRPDGRGRRGRRCVGLRRKIAERRGRSHWGNENSDALVWKAASRTMNPTLSEERIAAAILEDPERGRAEWEAEWRVGVSAALDPESIQARLGPCIYHDHAEYVRTLDAIGPSKESAPNSMPSYSGQKRKHTRSPNLCREVLQGTAGGVSRPFAFRTFSTVGLWS